MSLVKDNHSSIQVDTVHLTALWNGKMERARERESSSRILAFMEIGNDSANHNTKLSVDAQLWSHISSSDVMGMDG